MAQVISFEDDIAAGDTRNDAGLFDEDDDPFNLPPPLPPLSPQRNDQAVNQDGDVGAGEGETKAQDKKRKTKRSPQPKLDAVRLCSDRGLPALLHLCDDIKFKGKGHEASDLKLLLQRYEHWAHRLFPKFPFVDVVDQVENLGAKKLVQNCVKRIRRGEDDTLADEDKSDTEMAQNDEPQDSITASQTAATPVFNTIQSFGGQVEAQDRVVILTPEQKERIRLNKEKALAKRKAALEKAAKQNSSQTSRRERLDNQTEDLPATDNVDDSNEDAVTANHHSATSHASTHDDIEMEDGSRGETDLTEESIEVASARDNEQSVDNFEKSSATSDEPKVADEPKVSNNEPKVADNEPKVADNEPTVAEDAEMPIAAEENVESEIRHEESGKEISQDINDVTNSTDKTVVESERSVVCNTSRNKERPSDLDSALSVQDMSSPLRQTSGSNTEDIAQALNTEGPKEVSETCTTEQAPTENGQGVEQAVVEQPMEMED